MGTMDSWFDDPCLDDTEEEYEGHSFKGDSWRALMHAKENGMSLIRVAGTTYRPESIEKALSRSSPKVSLAAEPTNPHDPEAVRVNVEGCHVGYIPRKRRIAPHARATICKWGLKPQPHIWLAVRE